MTAESWEKDGFISMRAGEDFIVAVADDTAQCFVQRTLMLRLSITVEEDEVGVAVNRSGTGSASIQLVLLLLQEGSFDMSKHGDLTDAVDSLGRMNVAVAAVLSMAIVHKRVIDVDHVVVEIDVAPAEANGFTNTHAGAKQNRKYRIPVPVLRCTLEVIKEQRLFFQRQGSALFDVAASKLQLLHHLSCRIKPDVTIVDCHIQHLMQYRMDAVHRSDGQAALINQRVVEALDIGLDDSAKLLFAKACFDIHVVQIAVVLEGVVLQTAFELLPLLEDVIHRVKTAFGADVVELIPGNVPLLSTKLIQRFCVDGTAFAILVYPAISVAPILSNVFSFPETGSCL